MAHETTSRSDEDAALVSRCQAGEDECFDVLVERYQRVIYNIAFRIVGSREDALDVAQTTFLKAYEKLGSFRPDFRFFSWLYRIAVNESVNLVKKRRPREPLSPDMESDEETPQEHYARTRLSDSVLAAMNDLSLDARCVILLKHFLDLSLRDMSDILDIPEKTVKSRLYTARQQLAAILRRRGITTTCLTSGSGIESTGKSTGN